MSRESSSFAYRREQNITEVATRLPDSESSQLVALMNAPFAAKGLAASYHLLTSDVSL